MTNEKTSVQQLVTEAYKRALEGINKAIEEMQSVQDSTEYSTSVYREALESQISLERTKLELIRNELTNKKKPIFGRPTE